MDGYSGCMKELISPDLSVQQVLTEDPTRMAVFQRYGTDCVGCLLSRFCSISDVCAAYGHGLSDFVRDLSAVKKKHL